MHFYPNERLALFIDGANLYATAKALGFDIDYKRLLALFRTKGRHRPVMPTRFGGTIGCTKRDEPRTQFTVARRLRNRRHHRCRHAG